MYHLKPKHGGVILIYIRQQCLFSFEELIKLQPETKLTLVFKALDLSKVVGGLQKKSRSGPEGYGGRCWQKDLRILSIRKLWWNVSSQILFSVIPVVFL
jgi:hypothetical protein